MDARPFDAAGEAGARRLEIFHFSPKYLREEDLLIREAEEARAEGADPTA